MPPTHLTADQIIRQLNLQPLTGEGGLFAETYRCTETIPTGALPQRYSDRQKPFGTAIYYLLTDQPGSFSALHRLPTDEIYHFYLGDPLEMTLLYPDGSHRIILLGQEILNGQHLQFVVPAGVWQGSRVTQGGSFALVGTSMAPGFTPGDYEGGQRQDLLARYPQAQAAILALTRVEHP